MKIVIIGPAYPLRGGIADFNEALAKSLNDDGHDCSIFSFKLQYPSILFPGKTQYKEQAVPPPISIYNTINSVGPGSWIKTAQNIRKINPDLIIVRFWLPFMGMALGTICKNLKKDYKIVAITDNVIPHDKKPGDQKLTRYFLKQCHAFVTMSEAVSEDLKSFLPQANIITTPHPIYNIYGDPISKKKAREYLGWDNKLTFLFFGLVRKYKGLDLLIEALAPLKNYQWKLCIAGEFYDDPKGYHELVKKHDLNDRIILEDHFIPDEQIKMFFSAADMMIQPYKSATQSGVAQIAYHFETPMIVTDVGGLAEIVPHNVIGKVVQPNKEDLSKSIQDILQNPKQLDQFKQNFEQERQKYEWSYFNHKILNLAENIEK